MGARLLLVVAVSTAVVLAVAAADTTAADSVAPDRPHEVRRPIMRQLSPRAAADQPPGPRALVDARADVRRRFRGVLAQSKTGSGATRAAETLIDAATGEVDRRLKWVLLEEARRQAAAAGNALLVDRAVGLAAGVYDFDAIGVAYETLSEIPLRGIDGPRAEKLAEVAERLADRAQADGRAEMAAAAQALAIRGWQRAGADEAARRAAARLAEIEPERIPGRR